MESRSEAGELAYQASLKALEEINDTNILGSTNIKAANTEPTNPRKFAPLPNTTAKSKEEGDKPDILNPSKSTAPQNSNPTYSPDSLKKHAAPSMAFYSPLLHKHAKHRSLDAIVDINLADVAKKNLDQIRKEVKQLIEDTKEMDIKERRLKIRATLANLAKQYSTGNCEELATMAFLTLLKNDYPGKIEFVAFRNVDHVFVVLNRPDNTDPKNWKEWGKDTIILDPWIKRVFSAEEFADIWRNNTIGLNPYTEETFVKFDDSSFRVAANTQAPLLKKEFKQ